MKPTALIAIGGNSLIPVGEPASLATERLHVAETCRAIAEIASRGWRVVVTHGNGPQVGAALLRSERSAGETYELPLDACVAATQGEIGYLLQQQLGEALRAAGVRRPVAAMLAQVVVSPTDPAFAHPSKPIGPFYPDAAPRRPGQSAWPMVHDPSHGHRRAVPSPEPIEVVEEPVVRELLRAGVIVITLGGGGIPVVRRGGRLQGVEAVVDKDLASALLAVRLHVDLLAISTGVDAVQVDFGTPRARCLDETTAEELRAYAAAGQFPPGTMGPKVEAVLRFLSAGGPAAIVTSPGRLVAAIDGQAGTRVTGSSRRVPRGEVGHDCRTLRRA